MKKLLFCLSFIFAALFSIIKAELLIVKKTQDSFVSLDLSDEKNYPQITDQLLNYQWPMCIANRNMSQEDLDKLLTSDRPFSEETFIKEKLNKISSDYDVIFVPTTLFELFTASTYNKEESNSECAWEGSDLDKEVCALLDTPLSREDTPNKIREKIYNAYQKVNCENYKNTFFNVNNLFVQWLFQNYPILINMNNTLEISRHIKLVSNNIAKKLISNIKTNKFLAKCATFLAIASTLQEDTINPLQSLAKFIALEYEARSLNKGFLVRGSNPVTIPLDSEIPVEIIANSIDTDALDNNKKFFQLYEYGTNELNKKLKSCSLSFGNSLFAGALRDASGCVYSYLSDTKRISGERSRKAGLFLFIDKKAYYEHKQNRLFFVSPLASISALESGGDFFHSRTTGPRGLNQTKKETSTRGIEPSAPGISRQFHDPAGILNIERNPFKHASLLANYIAENLRILKKSGIEKDLSPEETTIYENTLKANQKKAAEYYDKTYNQIVKLQKRAKYTKTKTTQKNESTTK